MIKLKNVPKNWNQVTINQFIQLHDLPLTGNPIDDVILKLSVLTGVDSDHIKSTVTVANLNKMIKRINFISKMPEPKQVNWFMFKWRTYKRLEFAKTQSAQVADILGMNQKETNEAARILNTLAVIYYRGSTRKNNKDLTKHFDSDYTGSRFQKMKDELGELSVTMAWSATVFFWNGSRDYLLNVLQESSLTLSQMTIHQREELLLNLQELCKKNGSNEFISGMISYLDLQERIS